MMNKIYSKAIFFCAFFFSVSQLFAQTLSDGPIQLQVKLRDLNYNIGTLSDFTLSIGSFSLPGSLSSDEVSFQVWARDKADVDGYGWSPLGGISHTAAYGAPGVSADYNEIIYNQTFTGATVPQHFDVRLRAFEDDVPNDFSPISGLTPCGSTGSITTFETNVCCLNLFGCLFSEGDDNLCDAQPYVQNLNYRLGLPCQWYDHGYLNNASACSGDNFYHPRIESYWRYTDGVSCATAIDLGTLASGNTKTHFNSNECYTNTHAASPGNDVWYKFNVAGPIGITASLCGSNGAQFDSYLYLYSACGTAADTSDDDGCGTQSTFSYSICQPGTYYLVVDGKTATDFGTFTLTLQDNPNFVFSATAVVQNVSCFGGSDGQITVNVTGGAPPYTYTWNPAQGNVPIASGLGGGNYSISVSDTKGCLVTASATVTVPAQMGLTTTSTPVTCGGASDGTATANPTGGTAPYDYLWSSLPPQTFPTASLLPAGNYNVTVSDDNACTVSATVTVQNTTTVIIAVDSVRNVRCFGAANGGVYISTSGGQPPYLYAWSNSVTNEDNPNLGPNTYTLVITDNIGCTVGDTWTITEPPLLTSSVSYTYNPDCNADTTGIVNITVGGGVQPYSYLWNAPTNATTQNLNHVVAGTHTITITDANGCTDTKSATLTEPTALTATIAVLPLQCYGATDGSATATVGGATPPYTYFWSDFSTGISTNGLDGGPVSLLVEDAKGCRKTATGTVTEPAEIKIQLTPVEPLCASLGNGSITTVVTGGTGTITFSWSGTGGFTSTQQSPQVGSGSYTVTATDQNICTATASTGVNAPSPFTVNALGINPACQKDSSGAVVANTVGGNPPYSYAWSNSTADSVVLVRLRPGQYSVTVTDVNNCTAASGTASLQDPDPNPAGCKADNFVVLVPTAFSPNGDNVNDRLVAIVNNVQKLDFKVFNRWGEAVYENTNMLPGEGWDGVFKGREQPMGTYIYVYNVTYVNGVKAVDNGSTTLVR